MQKSGSNPCPWRAWVVSSYRSMASPWFWKALHPCISIDIAISPRMRCYYVERTLTKSSHIPWLSSPMLAPNSSEYVNPNVLAIRSTTSYAFLIWLSYQMPIPLINSLKTTHSLPLLFACSRSLGSPFDRVGELSSNNIPEHHFEIEAITSRRFVGDNQIRKYIRIHSWPWYLRDRSVRFALGGFTNHNDTDALQAVVSRSELKLC